MKNQFDWHEGEMEDEDEQSIRTTQPLWIGKSIWFLVGTAVIVGVLIGSWKFGATQLARSEKNMRQSVQTILDLEHETFLEGDGDLFFSVQTDDPAWLSAQLQPRNQAANRAGLTATRAEAHGDYVWANVSWTAENQTWQRIAFFQWQGNQLIHVPSDDEYWGDSRRSQHDWGQLVYHEIDESWATQIAVFVNNQVAEVCTVGCLAGKRPFTLVLANDYAETAVPNEIRVPSPRLLALDENGQPAPLFWQQLQQQIESYVTPATIRFAVPRVGGEGQTLIGYEQAAALFMADHPDIIIELVNLEELPDDLGTLAAEFDGAAVPPTEAMLAAGLVRDLTDYINTDPDFNQADFYEQIWRGATWQNRTWFMPQAANMHLLFYDKKAYREANMPEPSLRWTWEEMTYDLTTLIAAQPEPGDLTWGFLDINMDSLFSYAYNWNNQCTKIITTLCWNPLQTQNVAAALDWYGQMVGQPGQIPDLSGQIVGDQQFTLLNFQTARRQAVIWADLPVYYEYQLLVSPIGVVPFPGSDRFDGITPLWMAGSFISQESTRPLAVWQWLKFLSYQPPTSRMIPARPSVAAEKRYWTNLPRPLADAMRTAFPFARPIAIEEQAYLSWAQVTAVVSGTSPFIAAQNRPDVYWFRNEN